MKIEGSTGTWRNWSGSVKASPQQVIYPRSIDEVVDAVRRCVSEGRFLRVVGSGHSFTPLAASDDILISLDRMQGIVSVDKDAQTATVWAGTNLKLLGELLHDEGLAQENLGDIDVQTIAGAISTGTHGTGRTFGNLATQVVGLTIVTGKGEVLSCTQATHPELFKALQISLGALGIIVQVTLRLRPSFHMIYESAKVPISVCLEQLPRLADENRHFEFYWFPYGEPCQLKMMNETDEPAAPNKMRDFINDLVLENALFGALSGLCRLMPAMTATVSRISATNVPTSRKVDFSHRLFATQRLVRFNEMEYSLPAEAMKEAIQAMREVIRRERFRVHFPVECRYAKGDDIWLSPAYGRDSAYIAVHMYRGMPYERYFEAMEEIFLRYGGRPHWGKLHTLGGTELKKRYPMWESFLRYRAIMDPNGILLNNHLRRIFQ